jgi:hypothetical protein
VALVPVAWEEAALLHRRVHQRRCVVHMCAIDLARVTVITCTMHDAMGDSSRMCRRFDLFTLHTA